MKPWALRMFDASSKPNSGYLSGNMVDLGAFDQCVAIEESLDDRKIYGKYCLVLIQIEANAIDELVKILIPEGQVTDRFVWHMYEQIRDYNETDVFATQMGVLTFSLCVPNECTYQDLIKYVEPMVISPFHVLLNENTCTSKENMLKPTIWTWIFVALITIYTMFLVIISIYDLVMKNRPENQLFLPKKLHSYLICFSLISNFKKLVSTKVSNDTVKCIHGIRSLSMIWIILAHRAVWDYLAMSTNSFEHWNFGTNIFFQIPLSARVAVDTFFTISGTLLMMGFLKHRSLNKKLNIPLMYFLRYIRLTPPVAILIITNVFIVKYISSGPIWNYYFKTDPCINNWWYTILHMGNMKHVLQQCFIHTWYLAVDWQLFLVSPLILIPAWKWKKYALYYIVILTIICIGIHFERAWTLEFFIQREPDDFLQTPYYRAGSWLIGLGLGYILFEYKYKKVYLNPILVYTLWILTAIGILTIVFIGYVVNQNDHVYNRIIHATYIAFHRIVWSLIVSWIIFACEKGYGRYIKYILCFKMFVVLSKLSFSLYLLHPLLQGLYSITYPMIEHATIARIFYKSAGDFLITLVASIPLSLAFESPFIQIIYLATKDKNDLSKEDIETDISKDRKSNAETDSNLDIIQISNK